MLPQLVDAEFEDSVSMSAVNGGGRTKSRMSCKRQASACGAHGNCDSMHMWISFKSCGSVTSCPKRNLDIVTNREIT